MPNPAATALRTGLDRVLAEPTLLGDDGVTLCSNYTAVTADLRRGLDALLAAGVRVESVLTPEHGYWGAVQAGSSEGDGIDGATGIPVLDTYQLGGDSLVELLRRAPGDTLVMDLQDIGTRFYTYTWTVYDVLCAASMCGRSVVVLDRPNPLGRARFGPGLEPGCASFVGRVDIPLQHGLTLGEMAAWFAAEHVPEATGRDVALTVVPVLGWDGGRSQRPWVLPSPNMPTLTTAVLYPATALLEGTTLSQGRGTAKPFELFGAGWTDARLAAALTEHDLPGVRFRESVFRPAFGDWAGNRVHGAQVHLLDPDLFDPILTAWALLETVARVYPDQRLWREPTTEHGPDPRHFLDLLWGSPALREGIDAGAGVDQILRNSPPGRVPEPA